MCADIGSVRETLDIFESVNIEYLHIDVMDGVFVPNYTLGTDYVKQLRKFSKIPMDIHLMIGKPEDKLAWFDLKPGDYVSVHYESTPHFHRAISAVKSAGAKPMAALNPGTPFRVLENILDDIDAVLIMTVNPGYAGQPLIESMLGKISDLRGWLDKAGFGKIEIEADGNVSFENAVRMREAGADIFVAGSSSVFSSKMKLTDAIARLRTSIG